MSRRYIPKLSREEMERRRVTAGPELLRSGGAGDLARIARKDGVNPGTLSRWAERARKGA